MPLHVSHPMRRNSGGAAALLLSRGKRARLCAHILFRRLPKEKVRADGGSKNGDDHGRRVSIEIEAGPESAHPDFAHGTWTINSTAA